MFRSKEEYRLYSFITDVNFDIDSVLKRYNEFKHLNDVNTIEARKEVLKALKNVYTLIGTTESHDIFKNLGTKEYKNWKREEIYKWFKNGKIKPIQLSNRLDWHLNI